MQLFRHGKAEPETNVRSILKDLSLRREIGRTFSGAQGSGEKEMCYSETASAGPRFCLRLHLGNSFRLRELRCMIWSRICPQSLNK